MLPVLDKWVQVQEQLVLELGQGLVQALLSLVELRNSRCHRRLGYISAHNDKRYADPSVGWVDTESPIRPHSRLDHRR